MRFINVYFFALLVCLFHGNSRGYSIEQFCRKLCEQRLERWCFEDCKKQKGRGFDVIYK
ncbi:unnamed protein product [Cylicocyclus nassatus]|uniref:Uncharacterized protein n=1 Tax=Cylicocyclus nassatus TaxID=53992 RepID=A0AA36GV30_CYLNA|nr:unnamed protein product [Cylicocyclus nassatus]